MVKTATNPSVEATATTRSATERANRTNDRRDIDDAISRWEEMVQTVTDDGISEDQADIFASYADSLLLRWDLTHNLEDIQEVASNRGKALEKLPHSSTKRRYELLIRLGNVHQSWYQSFKDDPKVLLHAIQYWEEAHTLSVVLRQIKATNEILPSLANAYFVSFQDEISGIDSLHQAINYYQLALVQARPEMQSRIRIGLGKVYLELMYHEDRVENAQSAIDNFEVVLKKSKEKEELLDASNGKTEGWWWKFIVEENDNLFTKTEDFPLRQWTKSVATTYPDSGLAAAYHAMSFVWTKLYSREELAWYHLAWMLLKVKQQSPPPGFHYLCFQSSFQQYEAEKCGEPRAKFEDLPMLLSAMEHLGLFARTASLKDVHMSDLVHVFDLKGPMNLHPMQFNVTEWAFWREGIFNGLVMERKKCLDSILASCGARNVVAETEEVFRVQLESSGREIFHSKNRLESYHALLY